LGVTIKAISKDLGFSKCLQNILTFFKTENHEIHEIQEIVGVTSKVV
jgi:hypothetical protein